MINFANTGSVDWSSWSPLGSGLGAAGNIIAFVIFAAIIVLKGYSLWTAARNEHKWWFIFLLVLNTMGILELVYIIFIAKKWRGGMSLTNDENKSI